MGQCNKENALYVVDVDHNCRVNLHGKMKKEWQCVFQAGGTIINKRKASLICRRYSWATDGKLFSQKQNIQIEK